MKRVYRGHCPNESFFEVELERNCRNCEYFARCRKREIIRRKKATQRRNFFLAWGVVLGTVAIILLAIVLTITGIVNSIRGNSKEDAVSSVSNINIDINVVLPDENQLHAENGVEDIPLENITGEIQVNSLVDQDTIPYISAYEPGVLYYYNLTTEEKVYIAKVVYQEARGEVFEGKVAVAAVILNRYVSNDRRFDRDSIYSVVTQSGQFASIGNVSMDDLNSVFSCMDAVEAACKGWDPTRAKFPEGAKFFFNPDGDLSESAKIEREGIETYQIGNHLFHNDFNPT